MAGRLASDRLPLKGPFRYMGVNSARMPPSQNLTILPREPLGGNARGEQEAFSLTAVL